MGFLVEWWLCGEVIMRERSWVYWWSGGCVLVVEGGGETTPLFINTNKGRRAGQGLGAARFFFLLRQNSRSIHERPTVGLSTYTRQYSRQELYRE